MLTIHPGLANLGAEPSPWINQANSADYAAMDAYVAAIVDSLHAKGYPSATATKEVDSGGSVTQSGYNTSPNISFDPYYWDIQIPNGGAMVTVARWKDYTGGDPVAAADAMISTAVSNASIPSTAPEPEIVLDASNSYIWPDGAWRLKKYGVPPSTGTALIQGGPVGSGTNPTGAGTVADSIVNQVSSVVSAAGLSSIPTWAWLAGGAAALYFFMGRGK
jgi:hypothetical protein